MLLSRHGMKKDHGEKSLIREADKNEIRVSHIPNVGHGIAVKTQAWRAESSYEYKILLSPEEIIRCLLTLPAFTVQDAVLKNATHFDLVTLIPEVIKQLVAGAISAPSPQVEEEELEDDNESDD